jgi:hypothetical protein
MVVNPLIQGYEFSKCLMDGGSSLNIMYVETLTKLGLNKTQLGHNAVTFYGVVPGRQAKSLGSITLKVAFGDENNYREEPVTFEVIPFKSTYHVIFGRPAFHSFHTRPCYIYNQLKMPGPDGIITVYGSFRKAKECEDGEAAFAEAVFFGEEFKEIQAATDPAEMPPTPFHHRPARTILLTNTTKTKADVTATYRRRARLVKHLLRSPVDAPYG